MIKLLLVIISYNCFYSCVIILLNVLLLIWNGVYAEVSNNNLLL